MFRVLRYLCLIAPLVWGALWLANHPGGMSVEWFGYRIETTLSVFLAVLTLSTILLMTLVLVVRAIVGAPSAMRSHSQTKRHQTGLTALTHAMAALAISDLRAAEKYTQKATALLDGAPITTLLSAQLAHAKGDIKTARHCLDLMLKSPETRPVALRGMIEQAVSEKRFDQAAEFATEAWEKQPQDRWLALVLVDLYSRDKQWNRALSAIQKAHKKKALTRDDALRYQAIIHFEQAKEAVGDHNVKQATDLVTLARKKDPLFIPAQLLAVDLLTDSQDSKTTFHLIRKLWKHTPQAVWVDELLELFEHEKPESLQKRFEKLISLNPEHAESHIAMARCAIQNKRWHDARSHLKTALSRMESPRIYQLLSQVELAESGNERQASEWMKLAIAAPKDATWVCNRCNHHSDSWELHCQQCNSFDSYLWQSSQAALMTSNALDLTITD